jgi:UDPglucose 6-dehydrogenase
MRVAVIGAGYVGLTTGVVLAFLEHEVILVDKDQDKLAQLRNGKSPIHEPWLEELLDTVRGSITFSESTVDAVQTAEVIMIAVGTPSKQNGEADTSYVEQAAHEVAQGLVDGRTYTIVIKSTVPIGSNRRVAHVVSRVLNDRCISAQFHVASNPEFLREGLAVRDSLYPDRIVVGTGALEASATLQRLYRPLLEQTFMPPNALQRPEGYILPPFVTTDPTSSEMIKYAANAFLALKISFINEVAGLCERVGADALEVARGIGLDQRIGSRFLQPGLGWGGSCFPKDTAALLAVAAEYGYTMPIASAAREVNARQRQLIIEKLQTALKVLRGRTIGILGLAFKPNTDDIREAPSIDLVKHLTERGAHVRAHDPVAIANARGVLSGYDVEFGDDPYEVAAGCDALVLVTEWDEYRRLNLDQLAACMRIPILVDGRNLFRAEAARGAGFHYQGVGR